MDFSLTEEQTILQDSARRMVEQEIMPILKANDPDRPLPKSAMLQVYAVFAREGLTAPRLPQEDGGSGMKMLDYGLVFEQLPPAMAISLLSHECTIARIHADSSEAQKAKFLPDLLAGRKICCTGTTEPDTGSDPRGVRARVVEKDDALVINGRKMWITNGTASDIMIATCSAGEGPKGNIMRRVVVERDVSPYEALEISSLGLRQGHLSEILFNDCRVPKENALGQGGDAARILTLTWNGNRPLVGLAAVHLGQKSLDAAIEYSKVRKQFGGYIGAKQLIQERIADIAADVMASRLLCYHALDTIDKGGRANGTSAMAKRFATTACERAVSLAMHVHGAMGISREAGLEQLYRDVRMLPIPDGTNEVLTLITGRDLIGLDAIRA
ncbi:alkylation response protein AidB-like acyl-CoA dehydrogenase [Rhodoligotrophos appendicifer]|uniref:acyl-CoA dehydrogenase family protein n=1 Tax=Rhodoligotrophos appendicifer TaxID=987056 RepID=UPI0011867F5E|nr:acyl-CoA dehydrogenase family protein [Rhodoligotrophos appendicifer]